MLLTLQKRSKCLLIKILERIYYLHNEGIHLKLSFSTKKKCLRHIVTSLIPCIRKGRQAAFHLKRING